MGVYLRVDEPVPALCFTAEEANSTITLNKTGTPTAVTLETSTDGATWNDYTFGTTITLSNIGDNIYWRNKSETTTGFNIDTSNYYRFIMTGKIAGSGDITYLINKNSTDTLVGDYCLHRLFFQCASLTSAPTLPATNLTKYCYAYLFGGANITTPPNLPATTLADYCYSGLFYGTSLISLPSLPATTLAEGCYENMFNLCSDITSIPNLYATTLPPKCYRRMFYNCSKIKLSTTKTGEYQTVYRIPATGTGGLQNADAVQNMFTSTGGTWGSTPNINTTYYTSNTVV